MHAKLRRLATPLLAALLAGTAAADAQDRSAPPAAPAPPAPPPAGTERVLTGDHTVQAGETVDDVVVVGGDLRVLGQVTGDAVVVGGDLVMEHSGEVHGDAVVTGGEIVNRGGSVHGEMRTMHGGQGEIAEEIKRGIIQAVEGTEAGSAAAATAREHADEARRAAQRAMRPEHSWFDPIRQGFAGIISTLALGLVLAGIGSVLIFYGRSYLDTVSDTLRTSTLRSGAVGLAASFLLVPAFIALVVILAVSIIGIPLLFVAVPMYPLAIAAAVAMGLLAASHAIGERTAEQRSESFDLRYRNSYAYLFTGLAMLLTPLVAADLIGMTGFLGFLSGLLKVVTWAAIWAAATLGLGAVILSRAGTRRTFASRAPADEVFAADPLFEEDETTRGPHV